jgi:V/A-type H+/Na+-transporting ATPase subunit D
MAKVALNKSSLTKEREKLKLYRRVLPSLELKRQQLMGQRAKSRLAVKQARADLKSFYEGLSDQLPMLADEEIEVSGLVKITNIELGVENVVGVKLPVLEKLETEVAEYSFLGKPQWVDVLVDKLHHAAEFRLKIQVAEERARLMEIAVRKITQRVNLFEKIMIPEARRNIKRIQIFLGDADRSAVVRSKLAKAKRLKERASLGEGELA